MSSNGDEMPVSRANVSVEEAAAFLESDADTVAEFREARRQAREEADDEEPPEDGAGARGAVAAAAEAGREELRRRAEGAREVAEAAGEQGQERLRAARKRLARAAKRRAREGIAFDDLVDRRRKSRNQEVVERAERAATIAPPTGHTLGILGTGAGPAEMARASADMGAADLERPADGADPAPGLDPGVGGLDPRVDAGLLGGFRGSHEDPDWHDNPEHLDTAVEVRNELLAAGLNPMNVGTEQEALFGHALIHGFVDDADLGGRTPEQLEAEHDYVVAAMDDFGFDHDSPLDFHEIDGLVEEEL